MKNIFKIALILIICFFIGFSLPYLYNNYGYLIKNLVFSNGSEEIEDTVSKEENQTVSEENKDETIDFKRLLTEARTHFYNSNYQESLDTYIELYNKDYQKLETLKNIIVVGEYTNDQDDGTNQILGEAYTQNKDSLQFNYYYGLYLYQNGDRDQAKEVLNNFIILSNDNENSFSNRKISLVYNYLGNLYFNQDKYKVALDFYKTGINYSQSNVLNYLSAAKLYQEINDYNNAIRMYKKVLEYDHSLSETYYNLAILYEKINDYKNAYYYWDRAINSGVKTQTAAARVAEIRKEYPQLFEKKETKVRTVSKIKWFDITNIEPNQKYPEIKIGLQDNIDRLRFQSKYRFLIKQDGNTIFSGEDNIQYQINYKNHTFYILKDGKIQKVFSTNKKIQITSDNKNNLFALYDIKFGQNYFWGGVETRQYRGDIFLNPVSNLYVNLINQLDLTSYILSVVPSEMPANWPKEALKAQSVVARSYILKNINRHKDSDYDMCATVHCIVYNGVKNENANTTEAILSTRNEVLKYNGKIIDAVFSSNSGGITENSEYVWGNEFDYLKSVNMINDERFVFPLEPYQLKDWFIEKPISYSNNAYTTESGYRWIKEIDLEQLRDKHGLDFINDLIVTKRTDKGTVNEVKIVGNRTVTISNSSIRRGLTGLKSNKFIIDKVFDQDNKLKKLIIFGAGWGHSVGMDQTAAAGMALDNKSYQEIVTFFFPNSKLEKLK